MLDRISMGGMVEPEQQLENYKDGPWPDNSIVHENERFIVYKDGYPVTEGHLLFVPKTSEHVNIVECFGAAYNWGNAGVKNGEYKAFNIGYNNGADAGQSIFWPHIHLIPRRKGDVENPRGGVRHVIPRKGNY